MYIYILVVVLTMLFKGFKMVIDVHKIRCLKIFHLFMPGLHANFNI